MAAHTFAPDEALPPPKSTVIYSRDGRKRSLNIDITKPMAPSQDNPAVPSNVLAAATVTSPTDTHADAVSGTKGSPVSTHGTGLVSSVSHKKKKKKRTKKKGPGMAEESDDRTAKGSTSSVKHKDHQHHHGCQHHHHEDEEEDDEDLYSDEDTYDPETPALASSTGAGTSSSSGAAGVVAAATATIDLVTNSNSGSNSSKKKKKKKKKTSNTRTVSSVTSTNQHNRNHSHGNSSSSSKAMVQSTHRNGHDRSSVVKRTHDNHAQNDGFWHYSDAEERQRIREFWFQLREEERRSLVRVEKEAVLKKMKEQQRHSCSCSLCGRKRTAIEEELELLYDAYYDELEQYANQQQPSEGHALTYPQHSPTFEEDDLSDESRHSDEDDEEGDEEDDEDDDEEGYDDEDDDEEYDDEVSSRKTPFTYRSGFPNTLQAKGNILTVAEDLLENDGKKFLEMMDRLADRKVQRDDEALENRGVYEEYDDEEEGEFEDEGAEEDALTKEQRMEEGRRMFQAFAARMFEQRVLSAYREKVAQERQERLLAELEEESRQEQLREERKEREKEKRRDKKRLQRQQKEEEKAVKEAQRLAEERRLLEERERKLEADRKRREEEKRAKEEDRIKKEEEKQEKLKKDEERKRKQKEEKAREAEKERKRKDEQLAKEQEEQAKKAAEEAKKAEDARREDEAARKAEETAREEIRRQEREAYLKQQLAEEQRRQEQLRQQEQLAKQEQERAQQTAAAMVAVAPAVQSSPRTQVPESGATTPPGQVTRTLSDAVPSPSQGLHRQSPVVSVSSSPIHVSEPVSSQPLTLQGPSAPSTGNPWANPYPPQGIPQSPLQHMFTQPMQQGMYRPPGHFGHIGDLDPYPPRMGHAAGRGVFMGGSLQNQSPFQTIPQLQQPASPLPQQMGGLRSPGLPPIGYGQTNVPGKQLLTLMNPSSVSSNQDMANNAGSPLHSPSALGAIGTPMGSFGPISPIGHTRRTSTPYGPTTGDAIKPIQRPVPIGRPKDGQHHASPISNSFDSLSLGLSGLSIASDLDRRPRSPSLNLTGSTALDLDAIALGKDSIRMSNTGSDGLGHGLSNDPVHLQPVSPGLRNQRENSFFSNSIFGSRVNGHDDLAWFLIL
ncbi:Stress response protein nst1 [Mortierella sp. NVP85]|nr:Stress response protein nst1 [Mortierella sp. NVP85]